jgi:hypothetical protein
MLFNGAVFELKRRTKNAAIKTLTTFAYGSSFNLLNTQLN